jgi:molybdate-binding protein/DNA-binding XRE family transcriptional regulator
MASERPALVNRVRDHRLRLGWSQEDLARRSGLSRTGVSAIETDRLVPSASAALALAAAFGCRVEDVFALPRPAPEGASWAWEPVKTPCRYWQAEVGGRAWLYPVEPSPAGLIPHDGVARAAGAAAPGGSDPNATLVVAGCDPAVGLLAPVLAQAAGVRLVALARSSRAALELLRRGLVHVAGVHLARPGEGEGDSDGDSNAAAAREALGPGHVLLRAARWEEGIAFAPARRFDSVAEAVRADLRWVGREVGSGARQCLDELLDGRRPPRRLAADHRAVAEAVRSGWADAGVCLRLAGEEVGLGFLGVRREAYDLCFPEPARDDPRIQALVNAVRSASYRRLLGELPGYDSSATGETRRVV